MNSNSSLDMHSEHLKMVLEILQKHVPQYDVWAFGSRVKGNAKKFSDLDLVVISDSAIGLNVSADLSDDFSESDLPYKVDVVDWATTSESFRKIIEAQYVVIQLGKKV